MSVSPAHSGEGHVHDLRPFQHGHAFGDGGSAARRRALAAVVALTLATMLAELVVGWWSGSLALVADGWHMGTHALALGGALLAYRLAARAASHCAFGGWKIEVLAAYTSGLVLIAVALALVVEGVQRLVQPRPVDHAEAIAVAVIGLVVNLASMWMLSRGGEGAHGHGHLHGHAHDHHDRDHHHDHGHGHHRHGHDHNYAAATMHVLTDALTSVLAIAALLGGLWFGAAWLDPAVALLGAALIIHWGWGVLRASARALVDAPTDATLAERVRAAIESDGDARLADLHVWQVGPAAWSAVLSVVADRPLPPALYRERLRSLPVLQHVTVEVHRCRGDAAAASRA
jgi:cation diffusion facilitator family transporter